MDRFLDRLRDSEYLTPDEQREFDIIYRECASLAGMIGERARNLESIASFLSVLQLTRPDYRFADCTLYASPTNALRLLERAIRFVAKPDMTSRQADRARTLLQTLHSSTSPPPTIITTNYDIHVELAACSRFEQIAPVPQCRLSPSLYKHILISDPLIRFGTPRLYAEPSDATAPLLLKLHGSINWYKEHDRIVVDARMCPAQSEVGAVSLSRPDMCPYDWALQSPRSRDTFETDRPLIVPPTVLKSSLASELQEQWVFAANALRDADHLLFIGYSFPHTDTYMKYFLASGLSQNARLRQIAVIDPSRDVCFGSAAEVFADARHLDILQPFPFKWELLNLDRTLAGDQLHLLESDGAVRKAELDVRARALLDGGTDPSRVHAEDAAVQRGRGLRGRGRDWRSR